MLSLLDLSGAVMFYFRHLSIPQLALRQGTVPISLLQLIACASIVCAVTLILGRVICNKPSQGRGRLALSFARYERNYALRTAVYQDAPQLVITLYCARRLGFEDSVIRFSMVSSAVSMVYALYRFSGMRHHRSLAPRGSVVSFWWVASQHSLVPPPRVRAAGRTARGNGVAQNARRTCTAWPLP